MKQETTKEKTQISDKMGVSKWYELARFRSYCFEKYIEFYKCFSYACLMSTSNQSHFQLQWEVMASLCFASVGALAFFFFFLKKKRLDARKAV